MSTVCDCRNRLILILYECYQFFFRIFHSNCLDGFKQTSDILSRDQNCFLHFQLLLFGNHVYSLNRGTANILIGSEKDEMSRGKSWVAYSHPCECCYYQLAAILDWLLLCLLWRSSVVAACVPRRSGRLVYLGGWAVPRRAAPRRSCRCDVLRARSGREPGCRARGAAACITR